MSRFLNNPAVRVWKWYRPIVQQLLAVIAQTVGEIRLIADGTKVGAGHQLLIIAVAFRRRALPIAWTWVRSSRGHSSAYKQLALLARVQAIIPPGVPVLLVGDSEFGAVEVLRQLDAWGWQYVIRQKGHVLIQVEGQPEWQPFGQVVQTPRQSVWLGPGRLTAQFAHPVNLLAHWEVGEDEPWLLATSLPTRQEALRVYRRRPWVEEMFGDWKGHGFDLEKTRLRHFLRLSRLTLAVALLYLWLLSAGSLAVKRGQRRQVDRNDRRDLSLFQIGWRWVERFLVNEKPPPIRLCPYFC